MLPVFKNEKKKMKNEHVINKSQLMSCEAVLFILDLILADHFGSIGFLLDAYIQYHINTYGFSVCAIKRYRTTPAARV